jgi:hypothetical protein
VLTISTGVDETDLDKREEAQVRARQDASMWQDSVVVQVGDRSLFRVLEWDGRKAVDFFLIFRSALLSLSIPCGLDIFIHCLTIDSKIASILCNSNTEGVGVLSCTLRCDEFSITGDFSHIGRPHTSRLT